MTGNREFLGCQCENDAHFNNTVLTPDGKFAHKYGALWAPRALREVQTNQGTLRVCQACAGDCWRH